jgi:hypothetical protein
MIMSADDVAALPRTLLSLSLIFDCTVSDRSLAFLPPSLQTLVIPICTSISGACFSQLPRSLLRLELSKAHRIEDKHLDGLPSLLAVLDLASADITDEGAAKLPHSLISLNLEKNNKMTVKGLGKLPPHISDLNLIRPLRRLSDDDAQQLPQYLRSLTLGFNNTISDIGISKLPKNLEVFSSLWNENPSALAVRLLPRSIRDLALGWSSVSNLSFEGLPSQLHTLMIESTMVSDLCFKLLPSTLTSLTLLGAPDITDSGFRHISVPLKKLSLPNTNLTPDCLMFVPRSVIFLNLKKTVWNALRRSDLPHLPPYLHALEIDENINMTEEAFQHLPRGLASFSAAKIVLRSPERLADLPANLTRLRLEGHSGLTEALWEHMPKHLQFLYLPGTIFGPSVVSSFPQDLRELTLAISEHFDVHTGEYEEIHPKDWGKLPKSLQLIRCGPSSCFRLASKTCTWLQVDLPQR